MNIHIYCLFLVILFSNICSSITAYAKTNLVDGEKTIAIINDKLSNGTLKYEDIFIIDYGEYSEKNDKTKNTLDALMKEVDLHTSKSSRNVAYIDLDKIFVKNLNKIVMLMLDKKNMKYNAYGSNGLRWFIDDKNLKTPLNYFQQQVMLRVSSEILEQIGFKIVETVIFSRKDYIINFGILWPLYGNGCKLEKSFNLIRNYILTCANKVEKKQNLSQHEIKILKKILEMKNINQLVTSNVFERAVKMQILLKCNNWLNVANDILKKDEERKLLK